MCFKNSMIKIAGQLPNGTFLITDSANGFSVQTIDIVRRMLEIEKTRQVSLNPGIYPEVEVASYTDVVLAYSKYKIPANPSVVRVPVDSCITKEGNLTLRGNEPFYIWKVASEYISESIMGAKINNQDLGNVFYIRMLCSPIRNGINNNANASWKIAFYLPKFDFLTVLSTENVYEPCDDLFYCLNRSKYVFKLCGKTEGRSANGYVTNNWMYGYTIPEDGSKGHGSWIDMPDTDNSSLTVNRFLDVLERKGFIDIPMLDINSQKSVYGRDLGHGKYSSYEGKESVGTCFKLSFFSAFVRTLRGNKAVLKHSIEGVVDGVEYRIIQNDFCQDVEGDWIIVEYHNKKKVAIYSIGATLGSGYLMFKKLSSNFKISEDHRSELL